MSVTTSYEEVIAHKKADRPTLDADWDALMAYDAKEPTRSFYGNRILYSFQMDALCRTSQDSKKSLYDIFQDPAAKAKLLSNVEKLKRTGTLPNRVFEAWRLNGAIVLFKAAVAKWLYKKFNATAVLDPTAGWGGRALAAVSLGIPYTGCDTNTQLQKGYEGMAEYLRSRGHTSPLTMLWQSCLDADFTQIDYDFVLTSPPYINQELYSGMPRWESDALFYKSFLIPLLNKCRSAIRRGGWTAFNISPKMYAALLSAGYEKAEQELALPQQVRIGIAREDKIYLWRPL
jgi:hypothetical protein